MQDFATLEEILLGMLLTSFVIVAVGSVGLFILWLFKFPDDWWRGA